MLSYFTRRTVYSSIPIYNLNWISSKKFFFKILGDHTITLIDVGARAGSAEELQPLEDHISYIGFDADANEVNRLNSVKNNYKTSKFITCFVSSGKKEVAFKLYKVAGNSSVYDYCEKYSRWYLDTSVDYVHKIVKLDADSLDSLISDDVDVIKLDTQGTEYEILSGSERCLSKALIVEVEVEFMEMYHNQKLAYDVMKFMSMKGFDLLYLNRVFGSSRKFYGSSRGQLIFGDALFGLSRERALSLSYDKKLKYCSLLINYGHIDFAYDIFINSPDLQKCSKGLVDFFAATNRKSSKILRLIKFTLDKILFGLLHLRKTNGLKDESDRSWPIR